MIVYLLTNTTNNKKFVGLEVSDKVDVLRKHRQNKIVPQLHTDLFNHTFNLKILAKPSELFIAEQLESFYIDFYNSKDNGYNNKPNSIL